MINSNIYLYLINKIISNYNKLHELNSFKNKMTSINVEQTTLVCLNLIIIILENKMIKIILKF